MAIPCGRQRDRGRGHRSDFDVNWDDTVFRGGSCGTNVDSSGGAHAWTEDLGAKRGIDTWAFGDDPDEFNISLSVGKADLQVRSKTLSPSSFQIGDTPTSTFTWTLTVTNGDPTDVTFNAGETILADAWRAPHILRPVAVDVNARPSRDDPIARCRRRDFRPTRRSWPWNGSPALGRRCR